jgi:predicted DNA-binding protein (UPF0251 family)
MEKNGTHSELISAQEAIVQTSDGRYSTTTFEIRCHQELSKARDLPELMQKILAFITRLGFTDFSFGRMASKNPSAAMILMTTPSSITDHYRHEGVWKHDLMLQHAAACQDPIFQTTIDNYVANAPFKTEGILSNRETRSMVRSYGFHDYYAVPLKSTNGNGHVLLAITAKNMPSSRFHELVAINKAAFDILGRSIDYVGVKKFTQFFLDDSESREILITPRPLLLLNTMAKDNLTLNDAAKKLGMSRSTANKHIAAAREAFGAKTNASAVYRALQEGFID